MISKTRFLTLLCCVLLTSLYSQNFEKANIHNDLTVKKQVEKHNYSGLNIVISHKGRIIWNKSYGYSNLEYNIPVTDSSKFRIASLAKNFTGTAIAKLYENGKLGLDDYISKYIDSIPESWKNITIRQIAQHTSGIQHYTDQADQNDTHHYTSTVESLKKFMDRPLKHLPDEGQTYSSYAYTILAGVIEKVTGKDFLTAMDDLMFKPLGMTNTVADDQTKVIANRTGFYQPNEYGDFVNSPLIDFSGRWAGSGYLSTAIDLTKFGDAHLKNSTFLKDETIQTLTESRKLPDGTITKEGLGWGQRTSFFGEMMYWGNGRTPGCTSGLLVIPKYNLSIAALSNVRWAPFDRDELEALTIRLIAAIEGGEIRELTKSDQREFNFEIISKNSGNKYKGEINLNFNKNNYGTFSFHYTGLMEKFNIPDGTQEFEISDAFWKNNELWAIAIGTLESPLPYAVIPIKLNLSKNKGRMFGFNADVINIKK